MYFLTITTFQKKSKEIANVETSNQKMNNYLLIDRYVQKFQENAEKISNSARDNCEKKPSFLEFF